MSIIQEALKKAQNYIGEGLGKTMSSASERPMAAERKGEPACQQPPLAQSGRPNIILVLILFVTFAFALKNFLPEMKFKAKADAKKAVKVEDPKSYQEITYKPLSPKPEEIIKPQYPELILNGIMYLAKRPQAIINNSVVEEGDIIAGAKVLSIKKNRVVLSFDDVEISLSLKK